MAVIVGYITSPEGRAALECATREARRLDTELIVVHSERGGPSLDGAKSVAIEQDLAQVKASLGAAHIRHDIRFYVRGNDPHEDLVDVANEYASDFIVIGLRRRSPVGKLFLGSNAQRILLEAPCPVIAVKADDWAAQEAERAAEVERLGFDADEADQVE